MTNTATYVAGVVLPGIVLGIVFASLLNQNIRGRTLYRALYFVPVVAPTVAIALLWAWIYEANFGVLNSVLRMVGIQGAVLAGQHPLGDDRHHHRGDLGRVGVQHRHLPVRFAGDLEGLL